MPKLTKKLVESSLPREKDYVIWDDEIKGFGCRIYASGYKTYVFFYTSPTIKVYSYLKSLYNIQYLHLTPLRSITSTRIAWTRTHTMKATTLTAAFVQMMNKIRAIKANFDPNGAVASV